MVARWFQGFVVKHLSQVQKSGKTHTIQQYVEGKVLAFQKTEGSVFGVFGRRFETNEVIAGALGWNRPCTWQAQAKNLSHEVPLLVNFTKCYYFCHIHFCFFSVCPPTQILHTAPFLLVNCWKAQGRHRGISPQNAVSSEQGHCLTWA